MMKTVTNMKARRQRGEKGFSLVELLVVVAILAILAAIAIPLFLNQKKKAVLATATSDGNTIAKEIGTAVSDYTSLGTAAPAAATTFATISGTTLTLTLTTDNSQGLLTPFQISVPNVNLSPGASITTSGFAAGSATWCVAVKNGTDTTAAANTIAYTNTGMQSGLYRCSNVGVAS